MDNFVVFFFIFLKMLRMNGRFVFYEEKHSDRLVHRGEEKFHSIWLRVEWMFENRGYRSMVAVVNMSWGEENSLKPKIRYSAKDGVHERRSSVETQVSTQNFPSINSQYLPPFIYRLV